MNKIQRNIILIYSVILFCITLYIPTRYVYFVDSVKNTYDMGYNFIWNMATNFEERGFNVLLEVDLTRYVIQFLCVSIISCLLYLCAKHKST